MKRRVKVWGGLTWSMLRPAAPNGNHQARTIVAATSQKKAAELVGTSVYDFSTYWGETGNELELQTATVENGVWVDISGNRCHPQFQRVK